MIWTSKHIHKAADLRSYIEKSKQNAVDAPSSFTASIVGGGPKGLYALNHVSNQFRQNPTATPMHILWFNADEDFGCGPNYSIQQPDYLLINYCIGHIQAFHPDYQNTEYQKSFLEWLTEVKIVETAVSPTDFASRELVGHYLQWVTAQTIDRLPSTITLQLLTETVLDIEEGQKFMSIRSLNGLWETHSILLATGHCYSNESILSDVTIPSTSYFQSPYPISQFEHIHPHDQVAIVGMGLTFIDVALALTEGRGGVFADGSYQPSGLEPTLYPFSRTGFPICCRGPQYQAQPSLHIIHDAWFKTYKNRASKIDFSIEILPAIEQEIQIAYYSVYWNTLDIAIIQEKINQLPLTERFTLRQLLEPQLSSSQDIIEYIRRGIREAQKGPSKSPIMAASAIWSTLSGYISELYRDSGFTGESQKELDQYYFGAFNRVGYGPPIENMKKIIALAEAGIISFDFAQKPTVSWNSDSKTFNFRSLSGQAADIDCMIDARIARPSLPKNNAQLYSNLFKRQLIIPHDNESYRPGTLSLDKNGRCTSIPQIPVYSYGSNTEGVFFDNDTLSRTKNDTARYWVEETLQKLRRASKI